MNDNLKKVILLLVFALSNYIGIAQLRFGATVGAQFSSIKLDGYNTDTRLGFNTGLAAHAPVAENIDIHFQLLISGKGYVYYDSYGYKNIIRPLYLELPVAFRFKFNSTKSTKIFLGAGGYYAYGLAGNKIYYDNGYKLTEKINYGGDIDDDFTTSDVGLLFEFGAVFRENYEGHFFYDMGVTTIFPHATSNTFNRVFGFNLTWYFKSGSSSE